MAEYLHKQDNQDDEYTVIIESGETTYKTKAVFIGKETLRNVIKHRILKESVDRNHINPVNPME